MPLNKILGIQSETQLWALEMVPQNFRCDDKPIQESNKGFTCQNNNRSIVKNILQYFN